MTLTAKKISYFSGAICFKRANRARYGVKADCELNSFRGGGGRLQTDIELIAMRILRLPSPLLGYRAAIMDE